MRIAEVWVKTYDADDLRALENMPLENVIQGLEWYREHMKPWNMVCEPDYEDGRVYSAERYEATKRAMALNKALDAIYLLSELETEDGGWNEAIANNLKENWGETH